MNYNYYNKFDPVRGGEGPGPGPGAEAGGGGRKKLWLPANWHSEKY